MPERYLQSKQGLKVKYLYRHAKTKNYYASGRPRDLQGAFDWPNPANDARDRNKFFGSKTYRDGYENIYPNMPNDFPMNQGYEYYRRKAADAARANLYDWLYWAWTRAADIAFAKQWWNKWRAHEESKNAALKSYRNQMRAMAR